MEDQATKKSFCDCVGRISALVQEIENLKISLLGEAVIDREFDMAEKACNLDLENQRDLKNWGVEGWKKSRDYPAEAKQRLQDSARAQFDLAAKQTLEQLLSKSTQYCL